MQEQHRETNIAACIRLYGHATQELQSQLQQRIRKEISISSLLADRHQAPFLWRLEPLPPNPHFSPRASVKSILHKVSFIRIVVR